jgi:hypothetical protein
MTLSARSDAGQSLSNPTAPTYYSQDTNVLPEIIISKLLKLVELGVVLYRATCKSHPQLIASKGLPFTKITSGQQQSNRKIYTEASRLHHCWEVTFASNQKGVLARAQKASRLAILGRSRFYR